MLLWVLLAAALPVSVVYLLISHIRLKTRVDDLEQRLKYDAAVAQFPPERPDSHPVNSDAPKSEPEKEIADPAPDTAIEPSNRGPDFAEVIPSAAVPLRSAPVDAAISTPGPPKAYVFRVDVAARAGAWIAQNGYLAVAALSLALAGVFLVQYGVEKGLVTPFWRVMSAAALGTALIAVGEVMRRRWGDESASHVVYLPSTFAGAGLVALFAAAVSAHQLYWLIGPEAAFGAIFAIPVLSVILGGTMGSS